MARARSANYVEEAPVVDGWVVNANLAGAPTATETEVVIVGVGRAALVAVSVVAPDLLIEQPVKFATPETAVTVSAAHFSPEATGALRATEAVLADTALPPASCTVTTGCTLKTVPAVAPDGSVLNASLLAGPTAMVRLPLATVNAPAVAVSV